MGYNMAIDARTDREILIQMEGRIIALEGQMKNTIIRFTTKQAAVVIVAVLGSLGVGTGAL